MDPGVPINTALWSQFLPKLKQAGVKVEKTKEGKPYLHRVVDGKLHYDSLPTNFDQPDAVVGCMTFEKVCKNLAIDKNVHFKGWYFIL